MTLYEYDGIHVRKKVFQNTSWIFVTGDEYDVEALYSQLDSTRLKYEYSTMPDIYGYRDGIKIWVRPSRARRIGEIIFSYIGYGRKYRVYNADIDPVLRFMASSGLSFFDMQSLYDPDPDLNVAIVECKNGHCTVDGESMADGRIYDRLMDSHVIVYDGTDEFYRKIMALGFRVRYYPGRSYTSYGQISYRDAYLDIADKIAINSRSFFYAESGLSGIYEVSRVSYLPPLYVSIVTPGTAVSSMELAEAIRKGMLVPFKKDDHESPKTKDEMMEKDRGGLIFQPIPGVYDDVYEIDFSSMYPSIIVRYDLTPGHISFLPEALEGLLNRRLFYKGMDGDSDVYHSRNVALKWLLLTSFGYTGYKNAKFGKIEVHERITELGRKVLAEAIAVAHENGFEMIHGIVDSLWIRGSGSIDRVLSEIRRRTRIDIVLSGHYRWIAFLPERDGTGSPSRYFGLDISGRYKIRGIMIRRSDVPDLCKVFQMDALKILSECTDIHCIVEKRREIMDLESSYLRNIRHFPRSYFLVSRRVTRRPDEYHVRNLTRSALDLLNGDEAAPGQMINYYVVDERRKIVDTNEESDIDYGYYTRCLKRAFDEINFLFPQDSKVRRLEDFQSSR
ncbi:type B DNA-directed DNA polymerase [Thermoplasma sp.]|uniref:type B DNA-directed DNA polymerase n=1 Tax=Thermoplasma sp. TaxID=1973142 RepID=UPI00127F5DFB|nr:type B DNA-directed DNA polymerase [Thermoplasma sp.]KAA8922238.1 MAG: type B DNA-directed DNA polymerase [Thermoplasma sp.]